MTIGAAAARRGPRILSSSVRTQIQACRSFSCTPISSAFSNSPVTRAASTPSSAPKPPVKSSTTYKPASSTQNLAARTVRPTIPATEPPPPTSRSTVLEAADRAAQKQRSLTDGLSDSPPELEGVPAIDWTRSYHGLGSISFTPEQSEILLAPIEQDDVEVKPDGIIYLPEIKYRRILNKAFGPGGWGLAPRGESIVTGKLVTREYGLVVQGRYVHIS